jgi:hypothetical protein
VHELVVCSQQLAAEGMQTSPMGQSLEDAQATKHGAVDRLGSTHWAAPSVSSAQAQNDRHAT